MGSQVRPEWLQRKRFGTEKLFVELRGLQHQLVAADAHHLRVGSDEQPRCEDLVAAIKSDEVAEVVRVLAEGADPNAIVDEASATALHLAAARNQIGALEVLVEAGGRLDAANVLGRTPLMMAAVMGATAAVDWLLLMGADWRLRDESGQWALGWAEEHGQVAAAEALEVCVLMSGTAEDKEALGRQRQGERLQHRRHLIAELLAAAEEGRAAELARLMDEKDVHPRWADEESGATAMHVAASRNHTELMELLVAWTEPEPEPQTWAEAAAADMRRRVKANQPALPNPGLDLADKYGWTPLMIGAHSGSTEAVGWLLGQGADWRVTDSSGQAALDCARGNGKAGATRLLEDWTLEHGTAAERAPLESQRRKEQALREKQQQQTAEEARKQLVTQIIAAAKRGEEGEVSRLLDEESVDPNAADEAGITALAWAAWFHQVGVMKVLVKAGADLEKPDGDGYTPLMGAAGSGANAAVEWLLGQGADWRRKDDYGRDALDWAKGHGKAGAAGVLERWAAAHAG